MEARTREHLDRAGRNRDLALALIDPALPTGLHPPPLDWAVVAAFYSAVHYVNAHLWESRRSEPANHAQRRAAVVRERDLRPSSFSYARLRNLAFRARYDRLFQPSRTEAEQAVRGHLARVERTVLAALGLPLP